MEIVLTSSGDWLGGRFSVGRVWNGAVEALKMVRLSVKLGMQVENIRKYSTQHGIVLTCTAAYSEAKYLGTHSLHSRLPCEHRLL